MLPNPTKIAYGDDKNREKTRFRVQFDLKNHDFASRTETILVYYIVETASFMVFIG